MNLPSTSEPNEDLRAKNRRLAMRLVWIIAGLILFSVCYIVIYSALKGDS